MENPAPMRVSLSRSLETAFPWFTPAGLLVYLANYL
jgi:hypothetical protein